MPWNIALYTGIHLLKGEIGSCMHGSLGLPGPPIRLITWSIFMFKWLKGSLEMRVYKFGTLFKIQEMCEPTVII